MTILKEHNGIRPGDKVSFIGYGDCRRFGTVNFIESSWNRCGGRQYHYHVTDDHGVQRRISARFITKEVG